MRVQYLHKLLIYFEWRLSTILFDLVCIPYPPRNIGTHLQISLVLQYNEG